MHRPAQLRLRLYARLRVRVRRLNGKGNHHIANDLDVEEVVHHAHQHRRVAAPWPVDVAVGEGLVEDVVMRLPVVLKLVEDVVDRVGVGVVVWAKLASSRGRRRGRVRGKVIVPMNTTSLLPLSIICCSVGH